MIDKLLRCTECNQVIPRLASLGGFADPALLFGVEWSSEDLDREKNFFLLHRGHALEELTVNPETFFSDKPSFEPIKTSYVEASNGTRTFVIKRTRLSLDRPVSYELIPGETRVSDVAPGFRQDDVLEEMMWADSAFPAPKDNARRPLDPFTDDPGSISDESLAAATARICSGDTLLFSTRQLRRKRAEKSISML